MISRVLDFDAPAVRRALAKELIPFVETFEFEGSRNQFEMHEFYVPLGVWQEAAGVADEAVNL